MNKKEINEIVKNKDLIIKQKKANMKEADVISIKDISTIDVIKKKSMNKNQVEVTAVINTTNLFDRSGDVHIDGLWNKSLKESRGIMHLQEHEMKFDKVIADGSDLRAYAIKIAWSELGFNFDGFTEALIFESIVKRSRNEFMMNQYAEGNVKNHSVGMQYVKMFLAVNDKDYKEEFALWNKYYDDIANKDDVDDSGYFFAVTEAKVIEGSAVLAGSNWATPTRSVKQFNINEHIEPDNTTQSDKALFIEPSRYTLDQKAAMQTIFKLTKFNF